MLSSYMICKEWKFEQKENSKTLGHWEISNEVSLSNIANNCSNKLMNNVSQ